MRIVAIADIHGAHARVTEILDAEGACDVLVVAGDLTTHGTAAEVTSALVTYGRTNQRILAVAGNMDPPAREADLQSHGVAIDGKGVTIDQVAFFGVSACPSTPFHAPYELEEEEIARRAEAGWSQAEGARWKIFVPHSPPRRTRLDRTFMGLHVGSTAVREFVERRQPDLLICGHIHEARGEDRLGATRMVNCGEARKGLYAVLEIGDDIVITLRSLKR
jgi:Icc-related predicted phosphoesterase